MRESELLGDTTPPNISPLSSQPLDDSPSLEQRPQQKSPSDKEQGSSSSSVPWNGFKLCGDNIDKNVRRRHVRFDRQTISLHYFHYYAVKDRVNLGTMSDSLPKETPVVKEVIQKILPTSTDDESFLDKFAVLLGRMLCNHITYFKENFGDVVERHIPHLYSQDMSKKSEIVSL